MTGLRKALGDGKEGARYIATLPGRGYCFVAPVQRSDVPPEEPTALPSFPHGNLPARPAGMVGRDDDIGKLSARLHATRFVRSEEHTSELKSLLRISYAVLHLEKKKHQQK